MDIGNISPSKLESVRLCTARLAGRLNQLGEAEWEEDHGESAASGGLAHAAAKHWYRPNPNWLVKVRAGANPEVLALQAQQMVLACQAQFPAPEGEKDEDRSKRLQLARVAQDKVEEEILQQGLLKHPYTNPNRCFRIAIDECAKSEPYPGKIENELPRDASSVQEARDLFEAIITHYNRDRLNVVFAERRYKGKIGNGVPVHLIIDLAVDRGNGRLEIIDYKTGWITVSTEDMYDKDQVIMNLLAVTRYDESLSFYPHKSFTYFWVRSTFETGPVHFSLERLMDYEHYLGVMYQYMLNLTKPKENVNRFCGSCSRRTACTKYREHVSEAMGTHPPLTTEQLEALGDDTVMSAYERASSQIKLLEAKKSSIAEFLKGKMGRLGAKKLETDKFKAALQQNARSDYDVATILSLCTLNGVDTASVVSASKKTVDATFGSNQQAMQMLQMTLRRGATAPFVTVRAKTKKSEETAADSEPTAEKAP